MNAIIVKHDGDPTAVVSEVPEAAKLKTVLRLWLQAKGIGQDARKHYSAAWITCVDPLRDVITQANA